MKSKIYLNGSVISDSTVMFSGGEIQLVIPDGLISLNGVNFVEADLRCSEGVMLLMQLGYLLSPVHKKLHLGYLPYARYDRVEEQGDVLSIKVFCNMVNSLGFDEVIVEDCHSDVGIALLDNCINIQQHKLVEALVPNLGKYDAVVAPDGGSVKKAYKLSTILGVPLIKCDKVRDFKTGKITSFSVPEQARLHSKVLIVDDICDGGGTFIGLAKELHKQIPEIDLYVTHGIFSNGVEGLFDAGVSNIYAFNDWLGSDKVESFYSSEKSVA